jgi:hypothetical protein
MGQAGRSLRSSHKGDWGACRSFSAGSAFFVGTLPSPSRPMGTYLANALLPLYEWPTMRPKLRLLVGRAVIARKLSEG